MSVAVYLSSCLLACLTFCLLNFFRGIRNYNTEDTGMAYGPNGISNHERRFCLSLHMSTHRMEVTGYPQDDLCLVGCLGSDEMMLEGALTRWQLGLLEALDFFRQTRIKSSQADLRSAEELGPVEGWRCFQCLSKVL